MAFNIVDIILLACFIPAFVEGLKKGFIDQIIGLAGLIIGAWVAFHFSSALSESLAPSFENADPMLIKVLSFIALILLVFLLLRIIGSIVNKMLKIVTLGWLNRLAGLFFALFKAALIIGLILTLFDSLNARIDIVDKEVLAESRVYAGIHSFCDKIFPFLKSFVTQAPKI